MKVKRKGIIGETHYDHYSSLDALHAAMLKMKEQKGDRWSREGRSSFTGGSMAQAMDLLRDGDMPEHVQQVESVIDCVEDKLPLTSGVAIWSTDLVGHIPHVPNYLIGVPDTMMAPMIDANRECHPIEIYVDCTVSAGFSPKQIRARGAAIVALAVKVSQTRPVQLYALAAVKRSGAPTTIATVDLGVSPLNVPMVTFALANSQFLRSIMFERTLLHGGNGSSRRIDWPWGDHNADSRDRKLRIACDIPETSVLFTGAYLTDEMVKQPIAWVERELRKIAPEQFEGDFQQTDDYHV